MRRLIVTTAMLAVLLMPEVAVAVAPAATTVRFSAFRTPVQRGKQAKVAIHTRADLRCSIKVVYQGGRYSSAGLGAKVANGSGNASWTWIVPASTTPGSWPVTVTCQSGGHSVKSSRSMTITR